MCVLNNMLFNVRPWVT